MKSRKYNSTHAASSQSAPDGPEKRRHTTRRESYEPPRLILQGCLGALIRGSSWKGVDSSGQIDPDNHYPV